MDIDSAIDLLEIDCAFVFKDFQREALKAFATGQDVFVCVPTGMGKTACYSFITRLWQKLCEKESTVIVVSPLVALMRDQVEKLKGQGMEACCVCGDTQVDVLAQVKRGFYEYVFASPESLLHAQSKIILDSTVYRERLVGIVVDEAHCITQW